MGASCRHQRRPDTCGTRPPARRVCPRAIDRWLHGASVPPPARTGACARRRLMRTAWLRDYPFVPVCSCREGHVAPGPRSMFH
eukprot:7391460-Prymnesium_polylepis.3